MKPTPERDYEATQSLLNAALRAYARGRVSLDTNIFITGTLLRVLAYREKLLKAIKKEGGQ